MARSIIVTCEHASSHVPDQFVSLLEPDERTAVGTHQGSDLGASQVAKDLAKALDAPFVLGSWSRLLVDLNRSSRYRRTFHGRAEGELLWQLKAGHARHWECVQRLVAELPGPVVHLAVHSFSPAVSAERAGHDVGLHYDPARAAEDELARQLRGRLVEGGFRVRRNAPYRGSGDSLPTALRHRYHDSDYVGLEIELNQALLGEVPGSSCGAESGAFLVSALRDVLAEDPPRNER